MKKIIALFIMGIFFLVGCGEEKKAETGLISMENGNRKISFNKQPTRLVTLRQHITETALEMELDPYIVGASEIIDPPVLAHLQDRYDKLPIIAEKYPSPEVLFASEPDIIWVDRKWAFVKNGLGSMGNIERHGVRIYLSESGFHQSNRIEYVYEDIKKMGYLFNNNERANTVIRHMEQIISDVQSRVKDIDHKVRVMDFDSSRNNLAFVGAKCMADQLITLAGGKNIFQDIDKEWATVNWEEVIRRNPDVIVVHEYRGVSGSSKIAALKANPLLKEVNAVKSNRFVVVNLDEIYEGVRNAETVRKLAKAFYPKAFQ